MRVSYNGNTPAFQAGDVGSIPSIRSMTSIYTHYVTYKDITQTKEALFRLQEGGVSYCAHSWFLYGRLVRYGD